MLPVINQVPGSEGVLSVLNQLFDKQLFGDAKCGKENFERDQTCQIIQMK